MNIQHAHNKYALGEFSDNRHFAKQYKGLLYFRFWIKIYRGYANAYLKLYQTLWSKECYYGPFKGEFGHFLAHTLPFLMYLHGKGVKIHYCGMELHKPFMVDEKGISIVVSFFPIRDFFSESPPHGNSTEPPLDVKSEIEKFTSHAKRPFWNIGDDFYYWFIHRNWLLKGPFMKTYSLDKVYGNGKRRNAVIFPRSKGKDKSLNNGGIWDYMEIARAISPYFEKIYITGHPAMSLNYKSEGNIEVCVSSDNSVIIEKCSNSQLIITQHSGVNNIGEYTNNKVLIIYKGTPPIGSLQNTLRFRPYIGTKHKLDFAFSMEEIVNYAKNFNFAGN